MFNLLTSSSPIELSKIHRNTKELAHVLQFVFHFAPLEYDASVVNAREFHRFIEGTVSECSSFPELVDAALHLCCSYVQYRLPLPAYSCSPCQQLHAQTMRNMRSAFTRLDAAAPHEPTPVDKAFLGDVRTLLMSSYFYARSFNDGRRVINGGLLLDDANPDLSSEDRTFADKLSPFYKSAPEFLRVFCHVKRDANQKDRLLIQTAYDAEIIALLVKRRAPKSSPIVLSPEDGSSQTNVPAFLKHCSGLTWDAANCSDLSKVIFRKAKGEGLASSEAAAFYNQFIMERITSINFFNEWAGLIFGKPLMFDLRLHLSALSRFACSPLLNYRLEVLRFHQSLDWDKATPDALMGWNEYLSKLLLHQTVCLLPVLELVFHCLAATYCKQNPSFDPMGELRSFLLSQTAPQFFSCRKGTVSPAVPFPYGTSDRKELWRTYDCMIRQFFDDLGKREDCSILSTNFQRIACRIRAEVLQDKLCGEDALLQTDAINRS